MLWNPWRFLIIEASVVDDATVNPNGITTVLANDISRFFINGTVNCLNGSRILSRNTHDGTILDN